MAISDIFYIGESGLVVPDYELVLDEIQDAFRAIYGQDITLDPSSKDGQLTAVFAAAIHDCMLVSQSAYLSFSPSTSQAVSLSRQVKINGLRRNVATHSTADVKIIGQVGTTISGGQVESETGDKFNLPASVVIPISGEITVTAEAVELGAIAAPANTITKINTPTQGWQSVTNLTAATLGKPVETDSELRLRQQISVAIPSLSVYEGIVGAVAGVENVARVRGYENPLSTTDVDGLPPHSIAIVVDGGDTQEIANAIAKKKTPGTVTYGTTTTTTVDVYGAPLDINFFRPTQAQILVDVNITPGAAYTTGIAAKIKQAVVDYINSLAIGEDVILNRLFCPANLSGVDGATFEIDAITISRSPDPLASSNIAIGFNEAAFCSVANVSVTI